MYKFLQNKISHAEETIVAKQTSPRISEEYSFARLKYPNIYIPNRGAAWAISFKPEDSEEKTKLRSAIDSYNSYLDYLEELPGFKAFFIEHALCVSKSDVIDHWSSQVAEKVFSKEPYIFSTDLRLFGDFLLDVSVPVNYSAIIENHVLLLPIGKAGSDYPEHVGEKRIAWNWTNNGHDFCYDLWELFGAPFQKNGDIDDEPDGVTYPFDAYDQFRDEMAEPQFVRIFNKLENLGYIQTYTIKPENDDLMWHYYCKSDGSIDCGIVDISFQTNKLVMEQINQLLWTPTDELKEKPYFLTTDENTQLLSSVPGTLGGHNKLKIYGKLDCPSAAGYLAKRQYARNRVFFIDEETAVAAGYRPCAVCMPEAYKKWKAAKRE